ncbi:MAG: hypothetical protein KA154_13015, partial [Gemmatimonadaceae bacterium]|nr:hypothetical protein [Gemmatimonadaceae bacterium]
AFIPSRVADALEPLLDLSSPVRVAACQGLADVRGRLGTAGAAQRVALMATEMISGTGAS